MSAGRKKEDTTLRQAKQGKQAPGTGKKQRKQVLGAGKSRESQTLGSEEKRCRMLVELPASVKISVLAHGHSGILLKLSAQVALGGKAQIGGNLTVGIRRVHQEIFHQVHCPCHHENGVSSSGPSAQRRANPLL